MTFNALKRAFYVAAALSVGQPIMAAELKPETLDHAYDHDRWGTSQDCLIKEFRAFTSCFDSNDDDDGDGVPDALGVPEWVAYEIKRTPLKCLPTKKRPSSWITDKDLHEAGLMPKDESYQYPKAFDDLHKDWFERGHLISKLLAARLGEAAEWNSHVMFNAVPQLSQFNAPVWNDLEEITGAWAQEYGSVWVITGPVFSDRFAHAWLGQEGEMPVAIPDALFKIVVREGADANKPDVMAFMYPQIGPGYFGGDKGDYDHSRFTTTVDEIERLTGIDFLTTLGNAAEEQIQDAGTREIWPHKRSDLVDGCKDVTKTERVIKVVKLNERQGVPPRGPHLRR